VRAALGLYKLPDGRTVRAALDTIHEIQESGRRVFPCVLIQALRGQLGIGGATDLILMLMQAGAVEVDPDDGVTLTGLGEGLRRDVGAIFGLPANDTRPATAREGHA